MLHDRSIGIERLVTRHTIAESGLFCSAKPEQAGIAQPPRPQQPTAAIESGRPALEGQRRILLVDDSAVNRAVAIEFLSDLDCDVTTACNGKEAVDLFDREHFDMILMDCQMPIMDGIEATRKIRLREGDLGLTQVPIIALTANAFSKDRQNCLEAGMNDFLTKPLLPEQLEDTIARFG